jgi:LmbE family N-acetylglucosaminyl deacetylase
MIEAECMDHKRILGLFAHPDDEILGPGGTMAQYAAQGVQVETVCTTRGEAGEISDPELAIPENLGQVREQEMLCAAQALGIQKVHFLGYHDSGMAGTDENQNPAAYINAPDEVVVDQLIQIIRQFRPQVLITFEPYGGYGHPDHIAISKHTHQAYAAAADLAYKPELGAAWQVARLFYDVVMIGFFEGMMTRMQAHGMDVAEMAARFEERRGQGWPDGKVTCEMDVTTAVQAKWSAFQCHRTQFGAESLFRRLPEEEMKELVSREYFYLIEPEQPDLRLTELFEGL